MPPYPLVRAFAVDGTDEMVEPVKTLELPLPPTRNQWVRLPDGSELRVLRVVRQAREPATDAHGRSPGFEAVEWTEVELEAEPANQYETAVADGWKAEQG